MTRRLALSLLLPASLFAAKAAIPTRNEIGTGANEFNAAYSAWANAWNAALKTPGGIDAKEDAAFEPLPKLWRNVEGLRRRWQRGF